MIKRLPFILTLIALSLSVTTFGRLIDRQTSKKRHTIAGKQDKRLQHVRAMLRQQEDAKQAGHKNAERTTTVAERLIAISDYNYFLPDTILYALGKIDTTIFKYSRSRGSAFNYNEMAYNTPDNMYEDGSYINRMAVGIDATSAHPNYRPGVMCDSVRNWSSTALDTASSGFPLYMYAFADSMYLVYDANNNVVHYNDQTFPDLMGLDNIYYNTYDGSNNNISALQIQYDPTIPAYDTIDCAFRTFNAAGRLLRDSLATYGGFGAWAPEEKWIYSYDGSGNLVYAQYYILNAGTWEEQQRYMVTYDAENRQVVDSESQLLSGVWTPQVRDSFGYTAGASYCTYYSFYDFEPGGYFENLIFSKHVSAVGLPDTLFYNEYSSSGVAPSYLVDGSKTYFTYDSYDNPLVGYGYNYNITDSATGAGYYDASSDQSTHYYYETYESSGVNNVTSSAENISVYPNPATNEINISRSDAVAGSFTTIILTNELGQRIRTENLHWVNKTETFSLSGIPPGIYLLCVEDENGKITTQQIIRQ